MRKVNFSYKKIFKRLSNLIMKKLIIFSICGLVFVAGLFIFIKYFIFAWRTVQPISAQTLGQFGDSFGVCTSLLTFAALVGLIVQLWQMGKQHREECAQQLREHHEMMAAIQKQHSENIEEQQRQHEESLELQRKNHLEELEIQKKQHDEDLAEQKRQHEESLEHQRKNHLEELEVQRMGFLSAEHPLIQATPCAVMMFALDSCLSESGKTSYFLVWRFSLKGQVVPRNPIFVCALKHVSNQALDFGRCCPGQLSYSQSDTYEVVFPLMNIDPVAKDDECTIKVLFQNSLGGCFKYSETSRIVDLQSNKSIPETLLDKAIPELVTMGHSIVKYFMAQGFGGQTLVRTNQPILDMPVTNASFRSERQKANDIPYKESIAICQGVVDEQKLRTDLTEYLKRS